MDVNIKDRLATTIAHEYRRSHYAYCAFLYYKELIEIKPTKELLIQCHDAYADFVAHMYELIKGGVEIDSLTPKSVGYNELDALLRTEAEKHLKIRRDRIMGGRRDLTSHDIEYYQVEVPKDFGKHWRFIRNRRNHTDPNRVHQEVNITLLEFYQKYNTFLYLFYEWFGDHWWVEAKNHNWGAIEAFSLQFSSASPNKYSQQDAAQDAPPLL